MFKAIWLTQDAGTTRAEYKSIDEAELPEGEVDIAVKYSALNFKDALAITGRGAVVRSWPMVPGIDMAGIVERSSDPAWKPGDRVVVTGWGIGESRWGGLAQKARVKSSMVLRLPDGLDVREAMIVATAGFTAALCVMALRHHGVRPDDGEILVTGSAGGVGSVALALLAGLGYPTVASTGRMEEADYLKGLGASRVIDRNSIGAPGKPLQKEVWAGVVDSVGSHTLANACASTKANGAVTACGLAQGADFPSTVMPFILRGVTLYGINSVLVDNAKRQQAWDLVCRHVDRKRLSSMEYLVGLESAIGVAPRILDGKVRGRTVVDVNRP